MESQIIMLAAGILLLCIPLIALVLWIASLEKEVIKLKDKIREEYYQNSMRFMDLEQHIWLCKMSSGENNGVKKNDK